ncbi:hypothetical protein QC764_506500 [Podospora pseudoanserina]|uniref:Fucose-specific lectin n=1 Tax=Podospora pseudoanserina TaxID=2609844 RepID=A0ABR0I6B8_9PEZI|nr:hypothetical protein QC764_506500 [Podospora pseudoanserina]
MSSCTCHGSFPTPAQPPKYTDMQAIAAVVNPDTVDRGDSVDQQVILFQSLPNGTLGFDQVQFNGDHGDLSKQNEDGVIGYYVNPSKMVPTLKFGSSLATVVLDDVVRTYGVFEGDSSVWMLSPIVMPLANATIPYKSIAAAGDGNKAGRLFWQEKRSGPDGTYFQLKARDLQSRDDGAVWVEGTKDSKEGTHLAAFYDGEDFWVVYQNTAEDDNSGEDRDFIKAVALTGTTQGNIIPGSSDKINGRIARIAACRADNSDRVCVYFTDQYNKLHRSWAKCNQDSTVTFQKDVKDVKGLIINKKSGLSALASPLDKRNIIYAVTGTNNKISFNSDKWE